MPVREVICVGPVCMSVSVCLAVRRITAKIVWVILVKFGVIIQPTNLLLIILLLVCGS